MEKIPTIGGLDPNHVATMKVFTCHFKTYVGIKDVLTDRKLSNAAKVLFQLLLGHAVKVGYCWASNKYLAELMNCSESTLKTYLLELREEELIKTEFITGKTYKQRTIVMQYGNLRRRYIQGQKKEVTL